LPEIGRHADGIDTESRADIVSGGFRFGEIMQNHIGSGAREALGQNRAEAGVGAGHERPFALQQGKVLKVASIQNRVGECNVASRLVNRSSRVSTPTHSSSTLAIDVKSDEAPYFASVISSICRTAAPHTIGTPIASASSTHRRTHAPVSLLVGIDDIHRVTATKIQNPYNGHV
jgi:hypothetical protein